jgi:hypothetical protein
MPSSLFAKGHDAALVVMLEPLFVGKELLVLGNLPRSAMARAAAGAKSITWVTHEEPSERLPRHVTIVTRTEDIDRPAPFDAMLVADAASLGGPPAEALRALREFVDRDAAVAVAGRATTADDDSERNAGTFTYDAFCDLVEVAFGDVRLFGQASFAGAAIAAFDVEAEPPLVFDGTLLGDRTEPPFRFIAVRSPRVAQLDGYSIVQVERKVDAGVVSTPELSHLRSRLVELERELMSRREDSEALSARASILESTVASRTEALTDVDAEADRLRLALKATKDESDTRQQALQHARRELDRLRSEPLASENELADLEAQLKSVAAENLTLKAEIDRRGVLVRDLVEELVSVRNGRIDLLPPPVAPAPVVHVRFDETRVRELALRVHELESELASAGPAAHDAHAEASRAREERDALRAQLVEAEARVAETTFRSDELEGLLKEAEERLSSHVEGAKAGFGSLRANLGELLDALDGEARAPQKSPALGSLPTPEEPSAPDAGEPEEPKPAPKRRRRV